MDYLHTFVCIFVEQLKDKHENEEIKCSVQWKSFLSLTTIYVYDVKTSQVKNLFTAHHMLFYKAQRSVCMYYSMHEAETNAKKLLWGYFYESLLASQHIESYYNIYAILS